MPAYELPRNLEFQPELPGGPVTDEVGDLLPASPAEGTHDYQPEMWGGEDLPGPDTEAWGDATSGSDEQIAAPEELFDGSDTGQGQEIREGGGAPGFQDPFPKLEPGGFLIMDEGTWDHEGEHVELDASTLTRTQLNKFKELAGGSFGGGVQRDEQGRLSGFVSGVIPAGVDWEPAASEGGEEAEAPPSEATPAQPLVDADQQLAQTRQGHDGLMGSPAMPAIAGQPTQQLAEGPHAPPALYPRPNLKPIGGPTPDITI